MILNSAFRITGNSDDAEDVLQTVFMRLVKNEKVEHLGDAQRSYLQRAAINAALDIVRARQTDRKIPLELVESGLTGKSDQRPDRLRSATEIRKWLRKAVASLNSRAAEIFVLKFIEGYGNQEIAEMLGTSPGTVSVTLHRTRTQLRQDIQLALGGTS